MGILFSTSLLTLVTFLFFKIVVILISVFKTCPLIKKKKAHVLTKGVETIEGTKSTKSE